MPTYDVFGYIAFGFLAGALIWVALNLNLGDERIAAIGGAALRGPIQSSQTRGDRAVAYINHDEARPVDDPEGTLLCPVPLVCPCRL